MGVCVCVCVIYGFHFSTHSSTFVKVNNTAVSGDSAAHYCQLCHTHPGMPLFGQLTGFPRYTSRWKASLKTGDSQEDITHALRHSAVTGGDGICLFSEMVGLECVCVGVEVV